MKARIELTVDLGDPKSWMTRGNGAYMMKWVRDKRSLDDILADRLAGAIIGVSEYVGYVDDETATITAIPE